MNKSTGAGVIMALPKIAGGTVTSYNSLTMTGQDALYLFELALDADNAGDGAYVSVLTA